MAVQGEEGLSPPDPSFQVLEQDERGLIVEESPLNRSLKEDVDGVGSGSAYQIGDLVNVAKYGYGVVKWLGEVGGEAIAGIELEDGRDGCGNGYLPGVDHERQYFTCDDGHGLYTPLNTLTRDTRFTEGEGEATDQGTHTVAKRPTELFEQGSMVEVKGYGYGVVQWLGKLNGKEAAGVELEVFKEQCGDGTPEGGSKTLFPCQPGHSVFTPVHELAPDSRFMPVEAANPLGHVSLEPVDVRPSLLAIPSSEHYSCGSEWGIQGEHNSCYIDTTLFGLFALSSEFDNLLTCHCPQDGPQGEIASDICNTLQTKIINPLRKNGVIRSEPIQQLRLQLDKLGKMTGLTQEEKDPEEFLNLLLKQVLCTPPFISIMRPQGTEQEFFVQLFVEPDPSLPKPPSIEDLLKTMFNDQKIKFTEVPQKLLIQVPRYGKQFKTFERIIPNKRLDINTLCTSQCITSSIGDIDAHLLLLSVICIETSHYVCFTVTEKKWIFMDSMADRVDNHYNIPRCIDCTDVLEDWVYSGKVMKSRSSDKRLPELVKRFTQDVYMCIYIEDSTQV